MQEHGMKCFDCIHRTWRCLDKMKCIEVNSRCPRAALSGNLRYHNLQRTPTSKQSHCSWIKTGVKTYSNPCLHGSLFFNLCILNFVILDSCEAFGAHHPRPRTSGRNTFMQTVLKVQCQECLETKAFRLLGLLHEIDKIVHLVCMGSLANCRVLLSCSNQAQATQAGNTRMRVHEDPWSFLTLGSHYQPTYQS